MKHVKHTIQIGQVVAGRIKTVDTLIVICEPLDSVIRYHLAEYGYTSGSGFLFKVIATT